MSFGPYFLSWVFDVQGYAWLNELKVIGLSEGVGTQPSLASKGLSGEPLSLA